MLQNFLENLTICIFIGPKENYLTWCDMRKKFRLLALSLILVASLATLARAAYAAQGFPNDWFLLRLPHQMYEETSGSPETPPETPEFVVPEVPLGPIATLLACLSALIGKSLKRRY